MPKTGLSLPGFRTGTLMGNHDIRAGECDGMFSVWTWHMQRWTWPERGECRLARAGHETRQIVTINGASGDMDRHQYTSADSPAQLKPDRIICGRSIIAKLPVGALVQFVGQLIMSADSQTLAYVLVFFFFSFFFFVALYLLMYFFAYFDATIKLVK